MQGKSGITTAEMCVDAHVPSCPCQAFVLTIRNVLVRLGVYVLLCQAEVNDVYNAVPVVRMSAYQEILGLHVTEY